MPGGLDVYGMKIIRFFMFSVIAQTSLENGAKPWGIALGSGRSPQCCRLAVASACIYLRGMGAEKNTPP